MFSMVKDDIEKSPKMPEGKVQEFLSALYLVATPIGNLRDITLRALDVLRAADVVYCEDTRVTRKLLSAFGIKGVLKSYNDHSDQSRRDEIVQAVQGGKVVVLVSDAGMPMISDPGYKLVKACAEAGVRVTSLPGANAPLTALQLSAMPSEAFSFLGFLPSKTKARTVFLRKWINIKNTLVFFDTQHRIIESLQDIETVLGGRQVAVVRELTKLYEEVRRGTPSELIFYYKENGLPKGEIVVVVAPPDNEEDVSEQDIEDMIRMALKTMKTKEAAAFVAESTGQKKKDIYELVLKLGKE